MIPREPLLWRLLARVVSSTPIRWWIVRRALRTPYTHIGPQGDVYMGRWWVFNPYGRDYTPRWPGLPSIRLHSVNRPDASPHLHDHPLHSRAIILRGGYGETRYGRRPSSLWWGRGDTYSLRPGVDFHNIYAVGAGGALTLFITWPPRSEECSEWGFLVDGEKVGHLEYKRRFGREADASGKPLNPFPGESHANS